jgi:uncharacterized membrane protein YdbT with pleckstrin-like domain
MEKPAPTLQTDKKHKLGSRAFFIFLFARIKFAVFLFIVAFAVWYSVRWLPLEDMFWGDYAAKLCLMIAISWFAYIFIRTYLEYRYYTYFFSEDAFIMTYGYMVRNEMATLYHHIQNVNIERSLLDRMIGVSKIMIMMTGSDRDTQRNQIVLPAIGRRKARLVQTELLRRARRHAEAHFGMEE